MCECVGRVEFCEAPERNPPDFALWTTSSHEATAKFLEYSPPSSVYPNATSPPSVAHPSVLAASARAASGRAARRADGATPSSRSFFSLAL